MMAINCRLSDIMPLSFGEGMRWGVIYKNIYLDLAEKIK
jgi:hypothetical protein